MKKFYIIWSIILPIFGCNVQSKSDVDKCVESKQNLMCPDSKKKCLNSVDFIYREECMKAAAGKD